MKFTTTRVFLDFLKAHITSLLTLPDYRKQFFFFQIMPDILQKLCFYIEKRTEQIGASSCQSSSFSAFKPKKKKKKPKHFIFQLNNLDKNGHYFLWLLNELWRPIWSGFRSQVLRSNPRSWVQILTLAVPGCVFLTKSYNFSVPQFPQL